VHRDSGLGSYILTFPTLIQLNWVRLIIVCAAYLEYQLVLIRQGREGKEKEESASPLA